MGGATFMRSPRADEVRLDKAGSSGLVGGPGYAATRGERSMRPDRDGPQTERRGEKTGSGAVSSCAEDLLLKDRRRHLLNPVPWSLSTYKRYLDVIGSWSRGLRLRLVWARSQPAMTASSMSA